MSRQTATGCYAAAWLVWVIALLSLYVTRPYTQAPNEGLIVIIATLASAMVVCWFGAIVRLWTQHDWGWFAGVLVLQLIGLGIVGMAAYMLVGPVDVDLSKPRISA